MLIEEIVGEADRAWAKRGNRVVRKFRCVSGPRKGRIVANPGQCFKPIDIKKRLRLRRTRARFGNRITLKIDRTKRLNPASRRLRNLNR